MFTFNCLFTQQFAVPATFFLGMMVLYFLMLSGESPSSSASDVDNLNHPTTVDKVALPKGVSSPQVTGNHIIAARNRPNLNRLLNFVSIISHLETSVSSFQKFY